MDSDDDVPISRRISRKQTEIDSDDEPIYNRVQRKASLASREGIRKGARSESSNDIEEDEDLESASSPNASSDDGKKRKRKPTKTVVKRVPAKKVISKASKAKPTPKKKATPKTTPKPSAKSQQVVESEDEGNSEDDNNQQRVMRVINRTPKEQLVADLLCRWWYVLPDWPPADVDYAAKLKESHLRLVTLDMWETEQDVDPAGFMKCYALSQYKGLFRDAQGRLNDMRPLQGKPCYSEFIKRSDSELRTLISSAISKQVEILSASPDASSIVIELKEKLKSFKK